VSPKTGVRDIRWRHCSDSHFCYMKDIKVLAKEKTRIQIRLGGKEPQVGFVVMNSEPGPAVDICHDLEKYPYPIPDNSVDMLVAPDLVEHLNPHNKGFIKFMDECWRILKINGQFLIATPYAGSTAYFQDPTHCNPCNEATWYYFDPMKFDGALYRIYKPKPYRIVKAAWVQSGNMEVLLEKRPMDKSYE